MPDRFAWCFDHGRIHRFGADETPWCDAAWVWLAGLTEAEAMADKQTSYGDVQFFDQLTREQQLAIINGDVAGRKPEDDHA